ncbi:MAG: FtsQ-type POTRA domain-containing protein [Clostridia bacterium]|nr:FtsQ-type POTRA domain-containing protein [Clostridia bacterium]
MANSVERYYQKKKRRKKRAKVVFFGLLFVLMMLTLAILSVTVFFNAEEIIVEGNTRYTAEELLETGGLKIGQNLFRLDKFQVIDQMETLPYVKSVTIKRRLPNTLRVKVTENEPVVWIAADTGAALLNEEYRVLETVSLPDPAAAPEGQAVDSPVEGIPQLTGIAATELTVGKTAVFGEEDYTGFLKRLYEGFAANEELSWAEVHEVQFAARYDIKVLYHERITIDFGTLDQTDTKLELAAYLLNDNGMTQAATLDVSDTERVYYRPKK